MFIVFLSNHVIGAWPTGGANIQIHRNCPLMRFFNACETIFLCGIKESSRYWLTMLCSWRSDSLLGCRCCFQYSTEYLSITGRSRAISQDVKIHILGLWSTSVSPSDCLAIQGTSLLTFNYIVSLQLVRGNWKDTQKSFENYKAIPEVSLMFSYSTLLSQLRGDYLDAITWLPIIQATSPLTFNYMESLQLDRQ